MKTKRVKVTREELEEVMMAVDKLWERVQDVHEYDDLAEALEEIHEMLGTIWQEKFNGTIEDLVEARIKAGLSVPE